jgi:CBS domain-containing protein
MRARDVMATDVVSVSPEATVSEALRLMRRTGQLALPVLDPEGQVLGLVTETDLLALLLPRWLEDVGDLSFLPEDFQPLADAVHRAAGETLDGVDYHRDVPCAEEADSVLEVIRIMVEHEVQRVAVVRNGQLVGMIAHEDIARAILDPILGTGPAS